jgi:hypothetical protein
MKTDITDLLDIPPWEWPQGAREIILGVLRASDRPEADRALAAELAAQGVVMNDEVADALLTAIRDRSASEELRAGAAIALGPALEEADADIDEDFDDVIITRPMFARVKRELHQLFADAAVPKEVRRRILEAAVRAPEEWQRKALRAAYATGDAEWKLTAVFGMGQMPGFEKEILEALNGEDYDLRLEALKAAGHRELQAAWPVVESVLTSKRSDKDWLLAAINAAPLIRPADAEALLFDLAESTDEEIANAATEALAIAETAPDDDFADEDEEDEYGDDEDDEDEE